MLAHSSEPLLAVLRRGCLYSSAGVLLSPKDKDFLHSNFSERAADDHQDREEERSSGEAPQHPTTIYA